jgi:hypothetical protein
MSLAPQVEEQHLVAADRPVRGGGGEVMRVAGIALGADDRGAVREQILVAEGLDHLLLDVVLGDRPVGRQGGADEGQGPILDAVEPDRGVPMGREGGLVPDRLEALDEVARRDDLDAVRADQLDGAGVHPGQVGDGAVLRVLHGQPPAAS